MTRRKTLGLFLGVLALTGLCGTAPAGQRYISIATSSAGGTFSIIGTAMTDIINKNVPDVVANIEVTGGSSENLYLMTAGNVEFGFSASDVLYLGLNGLGSFAGKQIGNMMGVLGGNMNTMQVYTRADRDIKTYDDLKGKKIAVGPPGSVGNDAMRLAMEAYGYEINKDWTPEYLAHGDAAEALVDGNVDAVCIFTIVPCSPALSAAASRPLRLLSIDDEKIGRLLAENKFYLHASIPAGVYAGQTEPVKNTFGSASIFLCRRDMPEDLVYQVTKALYEHNDDLVRAYPQCVEYNPDNAYRGMTGLEMHPGSVKYLKEIGKAK